MGDEIKLKLDRIYHAAYEDLPDMARRFASHSNDLSAALDKIAAQVPLAGHPAVGSDMSKLGVDLFDHLRLMTSTLVDSADGLERIATDFSTTDTEAASWLQHHQQWLANHSDFGQPPKTPALPTAPKIAGRP